MVVQLLQENSSVHAFSRFAVSPQHSLKRRRPAITGGELDGAVEGDQPSSRTGICSFVLGETGGALPEPFKMTSSRLLVSSIGTAAKTVAVG
ncbi:unnamed protein product [Pleuronectes platessa]|uniref:Uncharacterized protein n=1 Tax=Pleuronectes platessa TaxID=8262 RepID=A0A9N7U3Z6_PLEPL|nr:unnamed protein product [Pleuronectes platessa]